MNCLLIGLRRAIVDRLPSTLSVMNYGVVRCEGPRALERIRQERYAAIAVDWDQKRAAGHEIVAEAKARNTPVIVLCKSLPMAMKAGEPYADIYLEKPVNPQELCAMIIALAAVNEHPVSADLSTARVAAAA
jgi:DNA-binding response OmpR family regulator